MGATKRKASAVEKIPAGDTCVVENPPTGANDVVVVAGADSWSRVAAAVGASANASANARRASAGRGSLSGWTHCPLCGIVSKKKHALGRGIATHLRDVHTPWNPGKLAQKIHRRKHERQQREHQQRERQQQQQQQLQRAKKRRRHPVSPGVEERSGASCENESMECNGEVFVVEFKPLVSWTPTEEEERAWAAKMLEIIQNIEAERTITNQSTKRDEDESITEKKSLPPAEQRSRDKTGSVAVAYRESLPPFLTAASNGDLATLQTLVDEAKQRDQKESLTSGTNAVRKDENDCVADGNHNHNQFHKHHHLGTLLNTRDRHNSTADHWAAGGGHLGCLRYLYDLRRTLGTIENETDCNRNNQPLEPQKASNTGNDKSHRARRRDGKTCLHYAARNGHVHCIEYLLEQELEQQPEDNRPEQPDRPRQRTIHTVDEPSGEGTTPLHLACYGGHPSAARYLVETHGADASAKNDWGCGCTHWAGMTISKSEEDVRELCSYLAEECGMSFVETQGHGHTALHKAAHRTNRHVVRWMADPKPSGGAGLSETDREKAGAPDLGGHKPSDIWNNMGGDGAFGEWMKTLGW